MKARLFVPAVAFVQAIAIAIWAGGLVVLGAIVAPAVFRIVVAPASADAMIVVFRRFDTVAMTSGFVTLAGEAALALRGGKPARIDLVRGIFLCLATGLAIAVGVWLAPGIEALHRAGAIRGAGESGRALERLHSLAEAFGKGQLVLLLAALACLIHRVARAPR